MHPDENVIQRLAHGEIDAATARAVEEHVQDCTECRARRARMETEEEQIDALLRQLDAPAPRATLEQVVARAREPRLERRPFIRSSLRSRSGWARWAAAVVLTMGAAGAVYAAPGSPLPRWLAAVRESVVGGTTRREPTTSSNPESAGPPAGIAVDPGRRLAIVFVSPQQSGTLTVALVDGAQVVIRATRAAPGFGSELDRVVIDNRGSSADFEIEIPRAAPRVEVLLGELRLFLIEEGQVTTSGDVREDGRYAVPWRAGEG